MAAIPYKIYSTRKGQVRVKYNCPHCRESLENELAEAGVKDHCPACTRAFIVPGLEKRKQVEAEEAKQKAEQRARELHEEELRLKTEAEDRKQKEIEEAAALAVVEEAFSAPPLIAEPEEKDVEPSTQACQFCLSDIPSAAVKCPNCQEWLDGKERTQTVVHVAPPSKGVAVVLSLFIPGAGQLYKGETGPGIAWLFLTLIGYLLFIVPGLLLHLFCIIDASSPAAADLPARSR